MPKVQISANIAGFSKDSLGKKPKKEPDKQTRDTPDEKEQD